MESAACYDVGVVSHHGVIHNFDERYIYVLIQTNSACAGCHVKGICQPGSGSERIVEVKRNTTYLPENGRKVEVVMNYKLGLQAVFWGYVMPFLILLAVLITALAITQKEGAAALISIGCLALYYLLLYLKRGVLRKKFEFRIKPPEQIV